MTQQYVGTKIVTAYPEKKEVVRGNVMEVEDGYGVVYQDGYKSWSPKDVFEASYIAIGHVGHLPPFVQRLIAEKTELDDRLQKLNNFLQDEDFSKIDLVGQHLLRKQAAVMYELSDILAARLELINPSDTEE